MEPGSGPDRPLPTSHRAKQRMAPPPELIDDDVAEILLSIPPDESAHLIRAALVCKLWCRIISDRAFLRRYRAPPLLGFFQNLCDDGSIPRSVPTTANPRLSFPPFDWKALDCRHGRTRLRSFKPAGLVVWDPISGNHKDLAVPPYPHFDYTAAVLCAADGCNHLDCRSGPFLVVFVGTTQDENVTWVSGYSSETGAWSASTSIHLSSCVVEQRPGLLVGDALYFILELGKYILKYDLTDGILSVIKAPDLDQQPEGIAMTANDGGLGFAGVKNTTLFLWSWNEGPDGIAGWVQHRVIALLTLLPTTLWFTLVGFAEGTDSIFVSTDSGVFTIKLKSGQARKVGVRAFYYVIVPYMSFYTPDLVEA